MINHSDDPILAGWFGSFQLVEVVLMEDIKIDQFVIEVHVLQFGVRVLLFHIDLSLFSEFVYEIEVTLFIGEFEE
jgi:hypothetical protein